MRDDLIKNKNNNFFSLKKKEKRLKNTEKLRSGRGVKGDY